MLGFIIEIGLTISAWKRGWGWKALIPIVLTCCISFGGGFMVGLRGGSIMDYWPMFIGLDVLCIIALLVMVTKPMSHEKMPSYRQIKNLDGQQEPKRAISSYGG